jgi:hypothetical protein
MFLELLHVDGPVILGLPWGMLIVALAMAGLVAGLLWILRITDIEPPDPAVWRYRDKADRRPPRRRRPPDEVPADRTPARSTWRSTALERRATIRWLLTRLELVVGATAIAATTLLVAVRPRFMGEGLGQPEWPGLLVPLGLAGALFGLAVMAHIAYRDPERHDPIWRSQHD